MRQTTNLEKKITALAKREIPWEPVIFNVSRPADKKKLSALLRSGRAQYVVDDYDEQLREYFAVCNPRLVFDPVFEARFQKYKKGIEEHAPLIKHGRWVYYPWLATLVHVLPEAAFYEVRTTRNRNLINAEEQKKFYQATIGLAGLSVGNSVALSIVLQGGGRHWRLADYDRLALSNTNRIRTGVAELGQRKVEMTARQIFALNPYAKIELFSDGLTAENIDHFFDGPPRLNVMIDEIDNLAVKLLIREACKKRRIPVVMAADNGDDGVVDIERYDKNKQTPFFHGRMGKVTYEELKAMNKMQIGALIAKYVGPKNVALRMQESLGEVGRTIVSWPQLGGAALLNGSAVAYCVRQILSGGPIIDNRAFVSLEEKLNPQYFSAKEKRRRREATKNFMRMFLKRI